MNNRRITVKRNNRGLAANKPAQDADSNMLVSKGFSKYKLPYSDEIPSGNYYSIIVHVETKTGMNGKTMYIVYYRMKSAITCYRITNGLPLKSNEDRFYYVKQVYTKGSPRYDAFTDAMAKALGLGKNVPFKIEDIIDMTEHVTLGYIDKSGIGGFIKRCRGCDKDFIKIEENYEKIPEETTEVTDDDDCEAAYNAQFTNLPAERIEDDEFDDFLPEDDEW